MLDELAIEAALDPLQLIVLLPVVHVDSWEYLDAGPLPTKSSVPFGFLRCSRGGSIMLFPPNGRAVIGSLSACQLDISVRAMNSRS